MAKNRHPFLKLSGKMDGLVHVYSKAYGPHVRKPRGTNKKATVNATLSKNAERAEFVSTVSKVIHNHIKSLCGSFKQSDLWAELMKRLFKANSMLLPDLMASVKGLEVNSRYSMERRVVLNKIDIHVSKKTFQLDLVFDHHPSFAKVVEADGYYYIVHVLWLNKKGEHLDSDGIETEWVRLHKAEALCDDVPSYELSFPVPAKACHYLIILELQAGQRERKVEMFEAMGMQVIAVGNV